MLLGVVGLVVFLISLVGSTALTAWFLIKLPPDYFVRTPEQRNTKRPTAAAWLRWAARNLLALALIILGIVLSFPGIPGQGILTILLGIMVAEFPGKERLERKIVSIPKVLPAVNQLRARFGKEPLVI
ncbi:MAG: hypothetical protein L0387_31125 [Acidobacteria bacterium]|nr:hypothetical protein [Acidobacteriota bacterium]MCI0626046.1 hypothetical protein [Acidobacteriota bacterium]